MTGVQTCALPIFTVNGSKPQDLFADLRRVIPLSVDPTIESNNGPDKPNGVTFTALSGSNTYYAVISLPWGVKASGTTSMS